jgi:hypothetical protein
VYNSRTTWQAAGFAPGWWWWWWWWRWAAGCAPEQGCAQPDVQYTRPDVQYTRPDVQYTRPDVQYDRPDVQYDGPDVQYDRPDVQYTRVYNNMIGRRHVVHQAAPQRVCPPLIRLHRHQLGKAGAATHPHRLHMCSAGWSL